MSDMELTAGGALFLRLKTLGVRMIFVNSGTDFPPIIEGLSEAMAKGQELPMVLTIPHEHVAMGMAHGWYFATGETPAVMLHTNVGLANGAIGAINAATDHVPVILLSGRTPATEKGRFGSRTVPIGWGQEMRDQSALVREACKWDYELRFPEQAGEIMDRAHGIANSTPKGPVYVSLPREVLCELCPSEELSGLALMNPAITGPRDRDIEQAAKILTSARRPVIFAQRGTGSQEGFAALTRIADKWGIPVVHYWACAIAIDMDHPMYVGTNPSPWLEEADAVLVIDSLAPWSPAIHSPGTDVPVVQLGPDPLYSRFPVRNFRADISITCETGEGLVALEAEMEKQPTPDEKAVAGRLEQIAEVKKKASSHGNRLDQIKAFSGLTKEMVGRALSKAIEGYEVAVLSELGCPLDSLVLKGHGSWRQEPHSGGLGWCLPCAMGIKMGDPERLVVATVGDGSYMFANPTACHQVMEAYGIPILVIIVNNAEWGAVRHSVTSLYPNGYAAKTNQMPMTALAPSPDFTKTAEASRSWARKITNYEELGIGIEEAIKIVTKDKRPALLDVQITG